MSDWKKPALKGNAFGCRRKRAFTFAETLVAMIFMSIALPVAVQGMLIANRVGVSAERKRLAVQMADTLLNELIVTGEWVEGQTMGDFGEEWLEYRWEMEVVMWEEDVLTEVEPMLQLSVGVFFLVQEQEYSVWLTTLVEEEELEEEEEEEEGQGLGVGE